MYLQCDIIYFHYTFNNFDDKKKTMFIDAGNNIFIKVKDDQNLYTLNACTFIHKVKSISIISIYLPSNR